MQICNRRALKLWMILRLHGVSGLRSYIRNHVELAKQVEQHVLENPRFEVSSHTLFA